MTLIKSISGIRGTIGGAPGEGLSPIDTVKFSAAYGTWLQRRHNARNLTVVIGRDARISGPIVNSLGFDLNRVFNELPIVALILTLTDAGALLIESLARSNDQQLAGAIIFLLTASIVALNFFTDVLLAILDPRIRKSIIR